jgi:hypothetical protein
MPANHIIRRVHLQVKTRQLHDSRISQELGVGDVHAKDVRQEDGSLLLATVLGLADIGPQAANVFPRTLRGSLHMSGNRRAKSVKVNIKQGLVGIALTA